MGHGEGAGSTRVCLAMHEEQCGSHDMGTSLILVLPRIVMYTLAHGTIHKAVVTRVKMYFISSPAIPIEKV